jgi:hypothetical protein
MKSTSAINGKLNGPTKATLSSATALVSDDPAHAPGSKRPQVGWSTRKINTQREEKMLMADYYVAHDFLRDRDPNIRIKIATFLVNPGTTQQFILRKALDWIKINDVQLGVDITWYTPGSLIPPVLKDFRDENPEFIQATQLFLFPGRLDIQIDSVSSPETANFVENYDRAFTYALLSANSFDIKTGRVYFHFSSEIQLQRAIALKQAKHKFLFLDSSKFDTISEGGIAYSLVDLLETSHSVTLYTASSSKAKDEWIKSSFDDLCGCLIQEAEGGQYQQNSKILRLRIVGAADRSTETCHKEGRLKLGAKV